MAASPSPSRRLWEAIEPIHAVSYFAPEPAAAARRIGLRGFWMSYFAGRVAPLGPVPAGAVTALVYGFAPAMVGRAIPDAWHLADPDLIVGTRIESAAEALRAHLAPSSWGALDELATLLWGAATGCRFEGRPLAAAWAQVTCPADPVAAAWLAATVLREHRGDGHVVAAVGAGLGGLEATITLVATGALPREVVQPNRGWTDEDWADSARRLEQRGLLEVGGGLTAAGHALRRQVEDLTDGLAASPVEALGETGVERAIAVAGPISRELIDGGVVPVPNPMGAPRP